MAGGAAVKNPMNFDEAWPILQEEAINKITDKLELGGQPNHQYFTSDEYMRLYTVVYNVCYPNPIGPEVKKLYDQYKKAFEDYISSKVLPSLRGKENENLLREFLRRWNNHKIMVYWLSRFFNYISRCYMPKMELPPLVETSHLIFYNLVHGEIKDQVSDIIISMTDREREGEQMDQNMVKDVLHIYEEIGGEDASKQYAKDIEEAIIGATSKFYSKKALGWIATLSCEDYMLKVEECLEQEKNRFSNYSNVIEAVQHELLEVHRSKLEEKN